MVAQGLGVGFAPRLALEPLPETVYAARPPAPIKRVIAVAVLPTSLKVPAVAAFLRMLREPSGMGLVEEQLRRLRDVAQPPVAA